MKRDDVLRVAKECGLSFDEYENFAWLLETDDTVALERFAAATYAAGAEDMRETIVAKLLDLGALADGEYLDAIRAIPINTEGENG